MSRTVMTLIALGFVSFGAQAQQKLSKTDALMKSPVAAGAARALQQFQRDYVQHLGHSPDGTFSGLSSTMDQSGLVSVGAYHFTSARVIQRDDYSCNAPSARPFSFETGGVRRNNFGTQQIMKEEGAQDDQAADDDMDDQGDDQAEKPGVVQQPEEQQPQRGPIGGPRVGQCRHTGKAEEWDMPKLVSQFKVAQYLSALGDAMVFFGQKSALGETLSGLRLWSAGEFIGLHLTSKLGAQVKESSLVCQANGAAFQCRPVPTDLARALPQ